MCVLVYVFQMHIEHEDKTKLLVAMAKKGEAVDYASMTIDLHLQESCRYTAPSRQWMSNDARSRTRTAFREIVVIREHTLLYIYRLAHVPLLFFIIDTYL